MKSLTGILMLLPFGVFAQGGGDAKFGISGTLTGLTDGTRVYLNEINNPADTVAAANSKDTHFNLSGHVGEPGMYELHYGSANKLTIFMGNDNMTLNGAASDPKGIVIKGSSSQQDFEEMQKTFNPYLVQLNAITQQANSPAGKNRDSLIVVYKKIVDSIQLNLDKFIASHNSSYVSAFILAVLGPTSDDIAMQEKRLHSLSTPVQKSFYGNYLQKQLDDSRVGAVGTEALDFTQTDTAGNVVSLSSFKGKYVLVDFWASWCGPCRAENPNVVNTYKKFKDKNFTVLGVSLDKTKEPWLKAIKDDGLVWTQVSDLKFWNNEVAVKYHVQSIPTNLLIDPNGRIVGKNLRGPDLQAKLCELLGCN